MRAGQIATALSLSLSLCLLLLSCGGCEPCGPLITYEVTGATVWETGVEYHNEHGDKERFSSVKLPWKKSFHVEILGDQYPGGAIPGDIFPAYVAAWIANSRGSITASIYVDGELKQRKSISNTYDWVELYYGVRLAP